MQPTIKDVARQAGVSTATVSRVLNESGAVSEQTRVRVEQAIKDLGYRYNALAGSLKKQQSGLIGHIVPSIAGPVGPMLARAVEEQARRSGYNVILCNSLESAETERSNVNVLIERRVDGIVFSAPLVAEHVKAVRNRGIPVVVIERRADVSDFHYVEADNFGGAYEAVKHLLDLGHRRIAMITSPQNAHIAKSRMDGYLRALSDAGISSVAELIAEGDYSRLSGHKAMREFLALEQRPTAVFAAGDALAIGAMQAAREAHLEIPSDISFVGFDDAYAELAIPPLTTVHQPLQEIGTLAARILIARIDGGGDTYPPANVLPCRLKERESCGPPPG